jgi:hypothetical protein
LQKNIKAQGLLNKTASPAPWISDPTVTGARERRGPRRAPGARVHGGPPRLNEGVRDLDRPSQIQGPWTRACGMRRRRHRKQGQRGGASPGNRRRALSCCSGRHLPRVWALRLAGERASKPRGSGGGAGIHGGRRRKGADQPCR